MQGYRPDWVGFVLIVVSLSITSTIAAAATRKKPERKSIVIISVVVGVACAFVARIVLHHFGI